MTVPSWVHMADVPPPVDEEAWTPSDPAAARRWSGTVAALALLAAGALVLVLVLTQQGGSR